MRLRLDCRAERCLDTASDAFLAFALALVVVWISTPVVKSLAWRIGAIDEPRAARPAPVPDAAAGRPRDPRRDAGRRARVPARTTSRRHGILVGAAVIVAVGVADDLLDLSADVKLAGQVLAAVIPVAAGVRVETMTLPFLGHLDLGATCPIR